MIIHIPDVQIRPMLIKFITPSDGKELLTLLAQLSSVGDPITSLYVYSHGYDRGIIMSDDEGFYNNKTILGAIASWLRMLNQRDIDDLRDMIKKGVPSHFEWVR